MAERFANAMEEKTLSLDCGSKFQLTESKTLVIKNVIFNLGDFLKSPN